MFLRATRIQTPPDKVGAAIDNFETNIVKGLRSAPGNQGAVLLVDRQSGAALGITYWESAKALAVVYGRHSPALAMLFHFGDASTQVIPCFATGRWEKRVDSADLEWLGPGACTPSTLDTGATAEITMPPRSFLVFERSRSTSE